MASKSFFMQLRRGRWLGIASAAHSGNEDCALLRCTPRFRNGVINYFAEIRPGPDDTEQCCIGVE